MIREEDYFGGSESLSAATGVVSVGIKDPRLKRVGVAAGGVTFDLPDARDLSGKEGGPIYHFINADNSAAAITVRDNSGTTTIATISPGNIGTIYLITTDTQDGFWIGSVGGVFLPVVEDVVEFAGTMSIGTTMTAGVEFSNAVDFAASEIFGVTMTGDLVIETPDTLELFEIKSEGNDFGEWDAVLREAQTPGIDVIAGAAMGSTAFGIEVNLLAGNGSDFWATKIFTWSTEVLRWRVYLDLDDMIPGIATDEETAIFSFYSLSGDRKIVCKLVNDSGTLKIFGEVKLDDGTRVDTFWVTVGSGAHYWEFELNRSTDNATSDATLQIWRDNISQTTKTFTEDPLFDQGRPTEFRLGAPLISTSHIGTDCSYYIDEIIVNESGNLIGAVGANPQVILTSTPQFGTTFSANLTIVDETVPTTSIVSPSASSGGGGDGSVGDPWNLEEGLAASGAGVTVYLRGGLYPENDSFQFDGRNRTWPSGTAGNRAVFRNYPGEVPIVQGQQRWEDENDNPKHDFDIIGINFSADVGGTNTVWMSKTGAYNATFHLCSWDSTGESTRYAGATFETSDNLRFTQCAFGRWDSGDGFLFNECTNILIDQCTMFAPCNHSVISVENTPNFRIQRCIVRNVADRAFTINFKFNGTAGEYGVVERNVFIDCDLTPNAETLPFSANGANMTVRYSVRKSLIRWNLFVGSNIGKDNQMYTGDINFSLFNDKDNCNQNTVYGNVMVKGASNGIICKRNTSTSPEASVSYGDNWVLNNIIWDNAHYQIRAWDDDTDIDNPTNGNGWTVENNLLGSLTNTDIYGKGATGENSVTPEESYSVSQAESAFSGWNNNVQDDPIFVDVTAYEDYDIDEGGDPTGLGYAQWQELMNAYKCNSGPSKSIGRHVCEVTADNTPSTSTCEVDRSYAVSDGHALVDGDSVVIVGPITGTVNTKIVNDTGVGTNGTTLNFDDNVTVRDGDKVYTAVGGGENPDAGLPNTI